MYLWIKTLHVLAVISWMAGILYLIRLYVYHAESPETIVRERLQLMERRLLNGIQNPAAVVSLLTGGTMLYLHPYLNNQPWMWVKLTAVLGMFWMNWLTMVWRKRLITEPDFKPGKYFRFMNEVPTIFMIVIVIMVIVQPWGR